MAIRKSPGDFLVDEVLEESTAAKWGPVRDAQKIHAVFRLAKASLTTPEAIARLGKTLRVKPSSIDYAGLKDKHARTMQHVSIPGIDARRATTIPKTLHGPNWSAALMGWSPTPLTAESIKGNRFKIVIRDLAKEASAEMDRRVGLLAGGGGSGEPGKPAVLWVVNYFGAQRFGSARHGQGFVAEKLIRGEFEKALQFAVGTPARKDAGKTRLVTRILAKEWGHWATLARNLPEGPERKPFELLAQRASGGVTPKPEDFRDAFAEMPFFLQAMYVEAFQSKLWNSTARRLVQTIPVEAKVARSLLSDDQFGTMAFLPASSLKPEWRTLPVPLLAPGTQMAEPWKDAAEATLAEENLKLSDLQVPGLKRPFFGEALRPLVIEATRFEMSKAEVDETTPGGKRLKRTVLFELPRGAYATVVLRALGQ